jgi:hypothetical protein
MTFYVDDDDDDDDERERCMCFFLIPQSTPRNSSCIFLRFHSAGVSQIHFLLVHIHMLADHRH